MLTGIRMGGMVLLTTTPLPFSFISAAHLMSHTHICVQPGTHSTKHLRGCWRITDILSIIQRVKTTLGRVQKRREYSIGNVSV